MHSCVHVLWLEDRKDGSVVSIKLQTLISFVRTAMNISCSASASLGTRLLPTPIYM